MKIYEVTFTNIYGIIERICMLGDSKEDAKEMTEIMLQDEYPGCKFDVKVLGLLK